MSLFYIYLTPSDFNKTVARRDRQLPDFLILLLYYLALLHYCLWKRKTINSYVSLNSIWFPATHALYILFRYPLTVCRCRSSCSKRMWFISILIEPKKRNDNAHFLRHKCICDRGAILKLKQWPRVVSIFRKICLHSTNWTTYLTSTIHW